MKLNPSLCLGLQLGLNINHHADQSLNSFCQWQSGLVGKGGKRHDHAVLLTGLDICSWKNEPCDTLGKNTKPTARALCSERSEVAFQVCRVAPLCMTTCS